MYKHILVPLDGSQFAEKVLPHVEALAKAFASRVTLVRVIPSEPTIIAETMGMEPALTIDPTPLIEAERKEAENYLAALANRLNSQDLAVQYKHLEGPPAETIVELASQLGVDLIAMTTHGRGRLRRIFLGSVADAIVRHASCPVLLVRVHEAASPAPDQSAA
ncbi:MAG: universal stress protein [Anaerolineae bacterium]